MNIFLTMDYEVFFGERSGSVEKCMIEPTQKLIDLARKNDFRLTFFWDVGHYIALEKFEKTYPHLIKDKELIHNQVKHLVSEGHRVELHIHPHWEKADYTGNEWIMNLEKHYKLSDFPDEERYSIFSRYKAKLEEVAGEKTYVFRAGGWCIQPFSNFKNLFKSFDIRIDSSVMPGISWQSEQYNLDFTSVETQEPYTFSDDVCKKDDLGAYIECPIATRYYSPLFFWKLYVLGRLFPKQHKMWGDGNYVKQPGGKNELLFQGKNHHVSSDGFFASELENSFQSAAKKKQENIVIIGHPKSLTRYALQKIDSFTTRNKENKRFKTLDQVI